jgi:hypothetical protein
MIFLLLGLFDGRVMARDMLACCWLLGLLAELLGGWRTVDCTQLVQPL